MFIRHLLAATTLSAPRRLCAHGARARTSCRRAAAARRPRRRRPAARTAAGRYDDLFTGGLGGCSTRAASTHASHDFARTVTAAGHATIATGTWPMHHGVVGNEWWERTPAGWEAISNVGDSTVRIVDAPTLAGVSPHYLERSGIAEWMLAADSGSRVASVSLKDRGAVLPAGRTKGRSTGSRPTSRASSPPRTTAPAIPAG